MPFSMRKKKVQNKLCERSNKTFFWTSKGLVFETDIKATKKMTVKKWYLIIDRVARCGHKVSP